MNKKEILRKRNGDCHMRMYTSVGAEGDGLVFRFAFKRSQGKLTQSNKNKSRTFSNQCR